MTTLRIIAVTPAGRRAYLELLAHYVLADDSIDEWQLWDNCRTDDDRAFLAVLAERHPKIRIVTGEGARGRNGSINQFYRHCAVAGDFFIKLDDDIVWLPPGFGGALAARAVAERGRYSWWSPVVVNNAICTWLMKVAGRLETKRWIAALADDATGWRSPDFAEALLGAFLDAASAGQLDRFETPDAQVSLGRYSINCIGFFGDDVLRLGEQFCPLRVDDEDWISATIPARTGRPGRVIGNLLACHFAFYTQEMRLLRTGLLDRFYALAGLQRNAPLPRRGNWRHVLKERLRRRVQVEITWRDAPLPALVAPQLAPEPAER